MGVSIHCFPASDPIFVRLVDELLPGLTTDDEPADVIGARLLAGLRPNYPFVRVSVQAALASHAGTRFLYVYRDGHALELPPDGPGATRYLSPLAQALSRSASLVVLAEAACAEAADAIAVARDACAQGRAGRDSAGTSAAGRT
jgi:hypothetical protein